MTSSRLYHLLVPDAPLHRRTDADPPRHAPAASKRAELNLRAFDLALTPGIADPSLISSCVGRIDSILMAFPSYGVRSETLSEAYQSVIKALRPGTRFIVVHHEADANTVRSWFAKAGHADSNVSLVPLPDYVAFTDWAEDGYVSLRDAQDDDGTTYLVEPWRFPRAGDALIADTVESFTPTGASQAPLIFQGGNCLVGDDTFWFLGKDYFADSIELVTDKSGPVDVPNGKSADDFVIEMFTRFIDHERKLYAVGTSKPVAVREYYGVKEQQRFFLDIPAEGTGTFQPIFHIDMFITLVGRGTNGRFQVFVGDPRLADEMLGTRSPYSMANVYDEIANQLALLDFDVLRNPLVHRSTLGREYTMKKLSESANAPDAEALVLALKELRAAGATDSTKVTVRTWHHITWNNCLVENDGAAGRNIYLPTFGYGDNKDLSAIDDDMTGRWEALGFNVKRLGDFNDFATRLGVVHCIKKYLTRTIAEPSSLQFAPSKAMLLDSQPLTHEQLFVECCTVIASVSKADPKKIREKHKLSTFVPLAAKANLVVATRKRFDFIDTTELFNGFYDDVGSVGDLVDYLQKAQPGSSADA